MGVKRLPAIAVVDHNNIAVSPVIPARIHYHSIVRRVDRIAGVSIDIDAAMIGGWRVIETGEKMVVRRPDEAAHSHGAPQDPALLPPRGYRGG